MEPEFNEADYDDFGAQALDTEMPPIPFTEEQFRYNAMISQTDFLPYMADRVDHTPFTRAAKRSLTDFLAAFFNQSVILSHSTSVREATLRFDLAMIEMKPSFAPSDVRLREYPGIMGALRAQYEFLMSRTVGGAQTRERVLQHGTVMTSRHEMVQAKPDAEKKEKLFGI
jgi:hypothetical protein